MRTNGKLTAAMLAGAAWAGMAAGQTTVDLRTQGKSVDFSQAPATKTSKTGTTLPASCGTGETFFKSDATAGKNLYGCTATNVWTLLGTDFANAYTATFAASVTWTVAGTVHGMGTCDVAMAFADTTKTPPENVEPDRVSCEPSTKDVTVTWAVPQAGKVTMVRSGGGSQTAQPGTDVVLGGAAVTGTAGRMVVTSGTASTVGSADGVNWNAASGRLSVGTTNGPATLSVQGPAADVVVASFGHDRGTGYQPLAEIRSRQTLTGSGNEAGRGALRLWDNIADQGRELELGFYEFGAGLFTENLFEFWTRGVSIRDSDGMSAPFLAVRDSQDMNDIRLRHDGSQGVIETTGAAPGGIRVSGSGPVTLATAAHGPVAVANDNGHFTIGASDDGVHTLQVGGPTAVDGVVVTRGSGAGLRFGSRFGYGDWQWYADVGTAYLYDHVYGSNRLTVHSSGLNVAGDVEASGYRAAGLPGLTRVIQVRKADDTGACSITVTQGLVTGTTCP